MKKEKLDNLPGLLEEFNLESVYNFVIQKTGYELKDYNFSDNPFGYISLWFGEESDPHKIRVNSTYLSPVLQRFQFTVYQPLCTLEEYSPTQFEKAIVLILPAWINCNQEIQRLRDLSAEINKWSAEKKEKV